jgi:hypothetical protein
MQQPLNYADDCARLVGYLVDHVPWPSIDEKAMSSSCKDTAHAWKDEFQVDMSIDHLYNTEQMYESWDD